MECKDIAARENSVRRKIQHEDTKALRHEAERGIKLKRELSRQREIVLHDNA